MGAITTHPACGKSWTQRGNRTGHCAKCHETFEGITAFDLHQSIGASGQVTCKDPATVEIAKTPLRLVDGTWRGPGMPDALKARYESLTEVVK